MNIKKKLSTLDIVYIGVFAAIIAVCSWLSIPLTVPITLQTMAVCAAAGLLGTKRSVVCVLVYILLGIIGIPVFAGFSSGVGYIFGATGGYLIGFIFTALIIGMITKAFGKKWWVYFISMVIGIAVCYLFGTFWFAGIYSKEGINSASLKSAFAMCVIPFIIPDLIKAALATVFCVKLNKFIK